MWAGVTDPHKFLIARKWNGVAIPTPNSDNFILYRAKPAWSETNSAVLLLKLTSTNVKSALSGSDIRAVATWRNRIVVVRTSVQGAEVVVLSDSLNVMQSAVVEMGAGLPRDITVSIAASDHRNRVYIRIADRVFQLQPGSSGNLLTLIEESVIGFAISDSGTIELTLVHDAGGVAYVSMLDSTLRRRSAPVVPLSETADVKHIGNSWVVVTPIGHSDASQVTIIDPHTLESQFFTVPILNSLLTVANVNGQTTVFGVAMINGRFEIGRVDPYLDAGRVTNTSPLPGEFGQPLSVKFVANQLIVLCSGGMLSLTTDGSVLSSDAFEITTDRKSAHIFPIQQGFLVSSSRGSMLLRRHDNSLWFPLRIMDTAWKFVVPILLLMVIGYLLIRMKRLRRVLDAMIDLPGTGLLMVLDSTGRLFRTNERSAKLLGITKSVPMRRLYRAYMRQESVVELKHFIDQALNGIVALSEKIRINDGDEIRDYVFTAVPMAGSFGGLRGWVVTGVDITEALERRRLVNWAQLAHDMQTNLSTIRLNAEQLSDDVSEHHKVRKRRILFQAELLIQRVRDIVSVGRTENIDRLFVHSAELCTEIRHEFDPLMFPNVTFSMKLRGTMMYVDRLKLSRAVRNAVENGIKSLKQKSGTIEIATWFDKTFVYVRVSDTGSGMDTATLNNMMKPFFTTAKDGSGTGIGTMIMQHVVHQHGGTLRVTSEIGKGTQVIFRIPHMIEAPRIRNVRYAVAEEAE